MTLKFCLIFGSKSLRFIINFYFLSTIANGKRREIDDVYSVVVVVLEKAPAIHKERSLPPRIPLRIDLCPSFPNISVVTDKEKTFRVSY